MFRESGFFFLALIGLVLLGFSKTYFLKLDESIPVFIHLHVLFLGGWLLLITGQAFLIRADQRAVHRQLGELSYLLAPMIVISGIYLARVYFHQRLGTVGLSNDLEFLWWAVSHFILFGILVMLALIYSKRSALHARFMIAASLMFVSPALLRVFDVVGIRIGHLSSMDLSFIVVDILLLALIINDLRKQRTVVPFSVALLSYMFIQIGVRYAGDNAGWRFVAGLVVDL